MYVSDASKYQNRYSTIFMADAAWVLVKEFEALFPHNDNSAYGRYHIKNENGDAKDIKYLIVKSLMDGTISFHYMECTLEAKLFIDGVLKGTMSAP